MEKHKNKEVDQCGEALLHPKKSIVFRLRCGGGGKTVRDNGKLLSWIR